MADSLDEAVDWLREKANIWVFEDTPETQDVAQVAHYLADLMMRVGNLEAIVQSLTDKMAEGFNAVAETLETLK